MNATFFHYFCQIVIVPIINNKVAPSEDRIDTKVSHDTLLRTINLAGLLQRSGGRSKALLGTHDHPRQLAQTRLVQLKSLFC
jgi:hypothetical protein